MTKKHSSSLHEKQGVVKPANTSTHAAQKIKLHRVKSTPTTTLIEGILEGNISMLSRAITLIESTNTTHQTKAQEVLEACLPHANTAIRIGITGVPGVGKSTFIEAFGNYLISLGKKVAVLAVDPSSSVNRGSILGDKTRMETLVTKEAAFIRPSPSGTSLGGVAQKTKESILLCEAAGFDIILVETVGVGQSETAVHQMVDFFLLLKLAGAGDELQGIKRGIIEMADAIVINKADGDQVKNASIAKNAFTKALHLYPPKNSGWQPKVTLASALEHMGIKEVFDTITTYVKTTKENGYFEKNRALQNTYWLQTTIDYALKQRFYQNAKVKEELEKQIQNIQEGKTTPFIAAQLLLRISDE